MDLPLRQELRGIEPYGAPQLDVEVCLNVNENPYAPSPEMVVAITEAVRAAAAGLNRYPDRDAVQLRTRLAEYLSNEAGTRLGVDNIWAANGSNEVMQHVLLAFGGPGRKMIIADPTYSMYPQYARDTYTELVHVPRRADYTVDVEALCRAMQQHRPAVVILPSPNNPTGTGLPIQDTATLARYAAHSGPVIDGRPSATVLVIDEAYAEFRGAGVESAVSLVPDFAHLVVSRTMSKAFGMAGLRLGYLAASAQLVRSLLIVRLPYHLSALTQAAAIAALERASELAPQLERLRRRRDALVLALRAMGLQVADTQANFCLFGPLTDADAVFAGLLRRGILIRQVGPVGHLRVSVGTQAEDEAFLTALKEVLA